MKIFDTKKKQKKENKKNYIMEIQKIL